MTNLKGKGYDDIECLLQDLQTNFFPEAEILDNPEPTKGLSKYSWFGHVVLKYFNEYYKIDYTCVGNGCWTSNFELHNVVVQKITKVKRTMREVITRVPEYNELENIEC